MSEMSDIVFCKSRAYRIFSEKASAENDIVKVEYRQHRVCD